MINRRLNFSCLFDRDSARTADYIARRLGSGIVEELLCAFRKSGSALCDENKGTLHGVTAVLDRFFAGRDSVNAERLYGILDGGEGGVADGVGIGGDRGNDVARGCQLLTVFARVLCACDGFKAVSCAASGFAPDEYDLSVASADFAPVLYLTGVDLCNGFERGRLRCSAGLRLWLCRQVRVRFLQDPFPFLRL